MENALILTRFAHFAAVMSLFGASLFPLYAHCGNCLPVTSLLRRGAPPAAIVALVSAVAWLLLEGALMSGDPHGYENASVLKTVLHSTVFGHIWQGRLVLLIVLTGFAFLMRQASGFYAWGLAALSGLAVATLAGVGHGAMGVGRDAWIHLGNQAAHMLAASVWVGGLTALVALAIGPTDHEALVGALKRFSAVGLTVVLIILASGLLNAWFLVGSVNALFTTPYGHVLLIKLAFFTAMIGLALYNRLALLPRLAGADDSVTLLLLKRSVAIEQACALAVVAAVSVLGTMEPAFGMKM